MATYSGTYKGFKCNNKGELAFVLYNIDKGINFIKNNYEFCTKVGRGVHKYTPPFKINDVYIETNTSIDISKFPNKITILDRKILNKYISYCKNKYGNDFERLYE